MNLNLFKTKDIKGNSLIDKVVNILNIGKAGAKMMEQEQAPEIDPDFELSEIQLQFIKSVSAGMTEDEIEELKQRVIEDPTIIDTYQSRSMLKDVSDGMYKPSSAFVIDVRYPARGFKAIKAL